MCGSPSPAPRALALLSLAVAACALPPAAPAALTQWTGQFGDDWFMDENWDTGVKPSASDDTLVLHGPSPKIEGNVATTRNLTLNGVIINLATVNNSPSILQATGIVGIAPGATVNVAGGTFYAGSTYTTPFTINNILNITNGGQVYSYHNTLGSAADLAGRVTVSGAGSLWDATAVEFGAVPKYINLGNGGVGTLDVLQGGKVISENARIGNGLESSGEARVIGNNSRWELTRFSGSSGTTGTLQIGYTGTGSLKVESGGYVESLDAAVGSQFGSTGSAEVRGTGSLLSVGPNASTSNAAFVVGGLGKGSLKVDNGGAVWSHSSLVGGSKLQGNYHPDDKTGTVLIEGAGSSWTTANDLTIGRNGTADVRVLAGGSLTATTTVIGGNTGTSIQNTTNGGSATVTVQYPGAALTSSDLYVATDGTGTLEILDAAAATARDIYVGGSSRADRSNPRASGHLLVSRNASLAARHIRVGNHGLAKATFSAGATVTSGNGWIGYQNTTTVNQAEVLVTGPGTTWANTRLSVGSVGPGQFTISDGAVVTQTAAGASDIGAGGTVRVTGPGSAWSPKGLNWVQGRLTVSDGAALDSRYGPSSNSADVFSGAALALVTGIGTTWTLNNLDLGGALPTPASLTLDGNASIAATGRLRLAVAAADKASLTQTSGTLTLGTNTTVSGAVSFGPGTSSYHHSGGTLSVRNVGSNHGIQADPAAAYSYTLAGGTVRASGTLTASARATLAIDTTSTLDTGAFAFEWSGVLTGPGHLAKTGPGTLTLSAPNTYTGATTVRDGTLLVGPGSWDPLLSGPGGADLRAGRIVFAYPAGPSPAATILPYLEQSALSNFATGQLRSSTATATHGLVWSDNPTTRRFTLLYTLKGDLNLDGQITPDDYALLDRAFAQGQTPTPADLNYDGALTPADYLLIDTAYASQSPTGLSPAFLSARAAQYGDAYVSALLTAIPEPASVAVYATAALFARRRHR